MTWTLDSLNFTVIIHANICFIVILWILCGKILCVHMWYDGTQGISGVCQWNGYIVKQNKRKEKKNLICSICQFYQCR